MIESGGISTSDHIPIVLTLAAKPIVTSLETETYNYKKANWQQLRDELMQVPDINLEGCTTNDIDINLDHLTNAIRM